MNNVSLYWKIKYIEKASSSLVINEYCPLTVKTQQSNVTWPGGESTLRGAGEQELWVKVEFTAHISQGAQI